MRTMGCPGWVRLLLLRCYTNQWTTHGSDGPAGRLPRLTGLSATPLTLFAGEGPLLIPRWRDRDSHGPPLPPRTSGTSAATPECRSALLTSVKVPLFCRVVLSSAGSARSPIRGAVTSLATPVPAVSGERSVLRRSVSGLLAARESLLRPESDTLRATTRRPLASQSNPSWRRRNCEERSLRRRRSRLVAVSLARSWHREIVL